MLRGFCLRKLSLLAVPVAGFALLFAGCGKQDGKAGGGDDHDHHHHAHPTTGPHKGEILEWGGNHEHHLELVIDREKQQATVYFLDHEMTKTVPTALAKGEVRIIDAENSVQIPLVASPQDGETAEKSSRYVATHAALGSKEPLTGDVRGEVGGTPYLASFEKLGEKPAGGEKKPADAHEDHDHKHGGHKHPEKEAVNGAAASEGEHAHDHAAETKGAVKAEDAKAHEGGAAKEDAHDDHGHGDHAHDDHGHEHADGEKPADVKPGEVPKGDAHDHEHGDAHDHEHEEKPAVPAVETP